MDGWWEAVGSKKSSEEIKILSDPFETHREAQGDAEMAGWSTECIDDVHSRLYRVVDVFHASGSLYSDPHSRLNLCTSTVDIW